MNAAFADGGRLRVLRVIARMNTGGPARQVVALGRNLDPGRFEHRLLAGSVADHEVDDLRLRGADVEHRCVRGLGRAPSPLDDGRALASLVAEVRRFRPHVVHTHTAKAGVLGRVAALSAAAVPNAARPALVHTFHGHLLHGYFSPRVTRAVVGVERGLARATDRLVAVGERVRDDLLGAGVGRAEQWAVVPPGIELGAVPGRAEARARLGLPAGAPVVAFVARLIPVKRPDRFVEVAARVAAVRPAARFVVAGGGEMERDVRSRVEAAGIGPQVSMLGWVPDIEAVYAAADVVVLCSDNEGMPVSLIEAALAGRPAVTTGVGSAAEVVDHGRTGLVVGADPAALADAVVALLDDPSRAAAMGAAAAERAERLFSATRLAGDCAAIYEEVVAARFGARRGRRRDGA